MSIEHPETPTTTIATPDGDVEERKRKLAYQFWEEEGRPEGRAEAHWEKACLVVMSLDAEATQSPDWLQRNATAAEPVAATGKNTDGDADKDEELAIAAIRKKIAARNAA